ncbi:MAG: ATP-binding cassette domain-containing protein, partial [Dehalococcoidia bacterium]|nr:ATP-binding cassette domain-containing protein [Dehalococcoidia bacterium]
MNQPGQDELMRVEDLKVYFGSPAHPVRAVDGVDFTLREKETVALVGESGCGKSVTALALARLVPEPPGYYAGGRVLYRGRDTLALRPRELRRIRGNEIAYIFQDPGATLNPVFTVGYQIAESLRLHRRDSHAR